MAAVSRYDRRSLRGRPMFLHMELAEIEATKEDDARKGRDADSLYGEAGFVPLAERAGKFIANSKHIPPTPHDLAATNPLLRALLRELQG